MAAPGAPPAQRHGGGWAPGADTVLSPPYRHYPKQSFTMVADTPENLRLKQQSELQSQVSIRCAAEPGELLCALCRAPLCCALCSGASLVQSRGGVCVWGVGLFCCLLFHLSVVAVSCLPRAPPAPQWDFPCWHPALQWGEMAKEGRALCRRRFRVTPKAGRGWKLWQAEMNRWNRYQRAQIKWEEGRLREEGAEQTTYPILCPGVSQKPPSSDAELRALPLLGVLGLLWVGSGQSCSGRERIQGQFWLESPSLGRAQDVETVLGISSTSFFFPSMERGKRGKGRESSRSCQHWLSAVLAAGGQRRVGVCPGLV